TTATQGEVAARIVDRHSIQGAVERAPAALVYRAATGSAGDDRTPIHWLKVHIHPQLEKYLSGHLRHLAVNRPIAGRQHYHLLAGISRLRHQVLRQRQIAWACQDLEPHVARHRLAFAKITGRKTTEVGLVPDHRRDEKLLIDR